MKEFLYRSANSISAEFIFPRKHLLNMSNYWLTIAYALFSPLQSSFCLFWGGIFGNISRFRGKIKTLVTI